MSILFKCPCFQVLLQRHKDSTRFGCILWFIVLFYDLYCSHRTDRVCEAVENRVGSLWFCEPHKTQSLPSFLELVYYARSFFFFFSSSLCAFIYNNISHVLHYPDPPRAGPAFIGRPPLSLWATVGCRGGEEGGGEEGPRIQSHAACDKSQPMGVNSLVTWRGDQPIGSQHRRGL